MTAVTSLALTVEASSLTFVSCNLFTGEPQGHMHVRVRVSVERLCAAATKSMVN